MKSNMSYFSGSLWFTAGAVLFSGAVGLFTGNVGLAISLIISTLVLGILETSVSLDNAVVNAKYLSGMNERSKHWFITWGMIIAVFGMRVIFPILIVCLAAWVNPIEAVNMALFKPEQYQHAIESVHIEIMGFGAAFLLMVCLEFFFNAEKETHWIPGIERLAAFIGKFPSIQLLIGLPTIVIVSLFAPHESQALMLSGLAGLGCYYAIHGLKEMLEAMEEESASHMVAQGSRLMIGSLIFLEVLDASFSFDGVIAAFAITNNFMIIAAGLGIGAMFVRSLTIYLVDKGTMSELKYLEHGAFVGIGWLVVAMFMSAYGVELGEIVVAGGAAGIIAAAALNSLYIKLYAEEQPADA